MGRVLAGVLAMAVVSGCQLRDVVIAVPEDVVVAEVILRAGASAQLAWLHRTQGTGVADRTVKNAVVEVRAEDGVATRFSEVEDAECFTRRGDTGPGTHGTCYMTLDSTWAVLPGHTYRLDITLPDGGVLNGVTTVPANFRVLRPSASICRLEEMTTFEASWTSSPGAWVYAAETNLRGIVSALRPYNITVNEDPLRLFGLSLSAADTTITFPTEFGLFERFDDDLTEALAFLQKGLPRGVVAEVSIAAADRNYVNWERGGNFNPSGFVRVPSISGDGTGVFGSLVPTFFQVSTLSSRPPC